MQKLIRLLVVVSVLLACGACYVLGVAAGYQWHIEDVKLSERNMTVERAEAIAREGISQ